MKGMKACAVIVVLASLFASGGPTPAFASTVKPSENTTAVLHNPDMGWVVYENYAIDQRSNGSSNIAALPNYDFPGVDHVALMASWADIETSSGVYDFSKLNYAYDYWKSKGKSIMLRISTESLLWWSTFTPPSGTGIPNYVLNALPAAEKQVRSFSGKNYTVADARDTYYLTRLDAFLTALANNFAGTRPVESIDLRGFGLWGEWHSGYTYASLSDKRTALEGIIDRFAAHFPNLPVMISVSYDPDSPASYHSGSVTSYDPTQTTRYDDYVQYSSFDYAMGKSNVTIRRDGVGGVVHSNERRLIEEMFRKLTKGTFMSEFCSGYYAYRDSHAGGFTPDTALADALSIHPNYINVEGAQLSEAKAFLDERPDLFKEGLQQMGYRLYPELVTYPDTIAANASFQLETRWVNRAVGRAMVDFDLVVTWKNAAGQDVASINAGPLETSQWLKGNDYYAAKTVNVGSIAAGTYSLNLKLVDPRTGDSIQLPLNNDNGDGSYRIGNIKVGSSPNPNVNYAPWSESISYSSSLQNYGWTYTNINDGNISTPGWSSNPAYADPNHTEWIQLDLGGDKTINRVDLYPRNDAGKEGGGFPVDFTIQVKASSGSWSTVVSRTSYPNPGSTKQSFTISPVNARYVKIQATKLGIIPNETYRMQLTEIGVQGIGSPNVPSSFRLLTPVAYHTTASTFPAFDWEDSAAATSYELLIDDQADFSSPVVDVSGLSSSDYAMNTALSPNVTYYWRVKAVNAEGSTWANNGPFSFTILDGQNVAIGVPVTASSSLEGYGWSKANVSDGNTGTPGWTSDPAYADAAHSEWVELDLGSDQSVSKVKLYPRNDTGKEGGGFPVDFTIQTRTASGSWVNVISETGYPNPGSSMQSFAFTPVTARYVRVQATKLGIIPGESYRMQLNEIMVYP